MLSLLKYTLGLALLQMQRIVTQSMWGSGSRERVNFTCRHPNYCLKVIITNANAHTHAHIKLKRHEVHVTLRYFSTHFIIHNHVRYSPDEIKVGLYN